MCVFNGVCVSGGNAVGIARIIRLTDSIPKEYSPNTIVVMTGLEREIIINFDKNVIGVIAEHGNIGSHGAGILRQLKIPCVLRVINATEIINNGDTIEIRGAENCIVCDSSHNIGDKSLSKVLLKYEEVSKGTFNLEDIKTVNDWVFPRPNRYYQKLRYDIMKDVYACSGEFLYNLPPAKTKQNEAGAIGVLGIPKLQDLCSFVLCNPLWLVDISKKRTLEFNKIKSELNRLIVTINSKDISEIYSVFCICVELYKSIFKYAFMSQYISDEILDVYLDFLTYVTGNLVQKDVLDLSSDYVDKCINSGIDPGVSQIWNAKNTNPHIWNGNISYTPLPINANVIEAIHKREDKERLSNDYDSFRVIVPLVYQLSEEYFYISSSINSFINWSLYRICEIYNEICREEKKLESFYDLSLNEIEEIINIIKGEFKHE